MENTRKRECKILKHIKNDNGKLISLIEFDNKKYILKKIINNDQTLINMLRNETVILNKLKYANVTPKLYNYSFTENNHYIIIELIKGRTLNNLNIKGWKERVSLMLKITAAVRKIHSLGIIHCDLKPDNIIVDTDNNIKLIDFGIAINNDKHYFKGYGNINYCSRSQALKERIDFDSDLYSLGIIFYELMCNKLPFSGTNDEIKNKKINYNYEKTDNLLLNFIFSKVFTNIDRKYKSIEEFEMDLKLLMF